METGQVADRTSARLDRAAALPNDPPVFVGRRWVLERLDSWLESGGRYFHLVGEPGSGKTALSRQLAHIAKAAPNVRADTSFVVDPAFSRLRAGFIDATHFCSARDRRMVNPLVFAESLGAQLAALSPVYTQAMLEALGAQTARVEQHVGAAENSTVIGVLIEQLNARGPSPEDAFDRLVREPLEAWCRAEPGRNMVILVDALDESLAYRGDVGIVPLLSQAHELPPNVRFIITSRPIAEIERKLAATSGGVERLTLSASEWDAQNRDDIAAYVEKRFTSDAVIAANVAALGNAAQACATAIATRANGNFLYARFLLDAIANGHWRLEELANAASHVAQGMDALYLLYMESLQRVIDIGRGDWQTQYAPVMETLSAAQETLPRDRLRAFSGQKEAAFRANLDNLRQFIEAGETAEDVACYRLYHQSFTEFLRAPTIRTHAGVVDNPFYLTAFESHARIADCLAALTGGDWGTCEDRYALRYAAAHFAGAAGADSQPERHDRSRTLVDLVTDAGFQRAHRTVLDDPLALRGDLERAVAVVAKDDHVHAPPLVVRAALALQALRREHARADVLFELAREGDVDGAERRLSLFPVDAGWRQAVSLLIAWLATPANATAARSLRDRVLHDGVDPVLAPLVQRLDVDLLGAPAPSLPQLPQPPGEHAVVEILERLGGNNVSGIEPLDLERMNAEAHGTATADSAPAYLAEADGPQLVSFALANPPVGDQYFTRYIAAQAANGYEYYRNRSLWALIAPVLAHPDPDWVRERLAELSSGALSPSVVHFGQALPLTVLALQGRAGDANANEEFERRRDAARQHADTLSPWRGEGDPWAHHLRRLTALAEIEALVRGHPEVASTLIDCATALPFGFAGFNAEARLTLSESLRFLRPADTAAMEQTFTAARGSAHNVQDFVFCARVTSRVDAMRLTWRVTIDASPLQSYIDQLVRDPQDGDFAARHEIGEQFELRRDRANRLPIPNWAREATTLEALSRLYRRPLPEFLRLSADHGWRLDEPLPIGTVVPVPDPDFPSLLAARFAADALAAGAIPAARRTRLAQGVIPVAARYPTALDVALSRLLLAALPSDAASLAHLAESVARYVPSELLGDARPMSPGLPA